jgi:hypothetical protein
VRRGWFLLTGIAAIIRLNVLGLAAMALLVLQIHVLVLPVVVEHTRKK